MGHFGAMPEMAGEHAGLSGDLAVLVAHASGPRPAGGSSLPLPWPAMMPATWVPCPLTSMSARPPAPVKSRCGRPDADEVVVLPEVGVVGLDAGVEHGPADVLADRGVRRVGGVGLDGGDRLVEQGVDLEVGPDPEDRPVESGVRSGHRGDDVRLEPGEQVRPAGRGVLRALRDAGLAVALDGLEQQLQGRLQRGLASQLVVQVEVDHDRDGRGVVVGLRVTDLLQQRDRDHRAVLRARVEPARLPRVGGAPLRRLVAVRARAQPRTSRSPSWLVRSGTVHAQRVRHVPRLHGTSRCRKHSPWSRRRRPRR